ncbi:E3 binding domain-containing protein, partial [Enterobacter cloacae]|uniref:E3 binding domain-containing protein n=1 Tax=Enterobacter cloacae TaxID=550 RepID=UPI001952B7C6
SGEGAVGSRVFASPLARRIAKQEGVDIAAVKGSGPNGRIIERDVREALASGTANGDAKASAKADTGKAPEKPAAKD